MYSHTRAIVAASTYAIITGKKVAGVYDHSAGQNLKIAAECRGELLQGFDGERAVKFGGALPELFDAGDRTYISVEIDGVNVRGHDRRSSSDFTAHVTNGLVQVYDYGEAAWFTYDIQDPEAAQSYLRKREGKR